MRNGWFAVFPGAEMMVIRIRVDGDQGKTAKERGVLKSK
jgi:hypothetical protein